MTPWAPIGVALALQVMAVCALLVAFLPLREMDAERRHHAGVVAQQQAEIETRRRQIEANEATIAQLRSRIAQEEILLAQAGRRLNAILPNMIPKP